ncbi:conserved hypothetical protein [Ricinus communis]|uniref:Uncharacterized protein n=1 Tax=Ricinus communis TaxID=3988 RepID=B9S1C9_RICCO|nr:conserved hypothetical protein [Ricinus communis]
MHLAKSESVKRVEIALFDPEIEKACKANKKSKKEHMANNRNMVMAVEENIPRLRKL